MEEDRNDGLSIGELLAETGLEARQVRYMISEGMMPPANGRGRFAAGYGPRHIDAARRYLRLQAAGLRGHRLKAMMASQGASSIPLVRSGPVEISVDLSVPPESIDVDRTLAEIGAALRFYVNPKRED